MQLFSADPKTVNIFKNVCFDHQKLKKTPPSKVAQNFSNPLFFLTALTAQTAQTEKYLFQNVAYWLTVYRTGTFIKSLTPMCINFFHAFDDVMQD